MSGRGGNRLAEAAVGQFVEVEDVADRSRCALPVSGIQTGGLDLV